MPSINISILYITRSSACWPIKSHRVVSAHLHTLAAKARRAARLTGVVSSDYWPVFSNHFSLSTVRDSIALTVSVVVFDFGYGCRFDWTLINGYVVRYGLLFETKPMSDGELYLPQRSVRLLRDGQASFILSPPYPFNDGFDRTG